MYLPMVVASAVIVIAATLAEALVLSVTWLISRSVRVGYTRRASQAYENRSCKF